MTNALSKKQALSLSVDELFQYAAKNDVRALHRLGHLHHNDNDLGVEHDTGKAFEFYQRAADLGFAPSLNNLALLYFKGDGVDRDDTKAFTLFNQACVALEADHAAGEKIEFTAPFTNLASHYYHGIGVEKNLAKARFLYEEAKTHGDMKAAGMLGYMMEEGIGGNVDYAGAIVNYELCANKGKQPLACLALYRIYHKGLHVEKDEAKALSYLEKYVRLSGNSAESHYRLGIAYLSQGLTEENPGINAKSAWHIRKSAKQGYAPAESILGQMHMKGCGASKNIKLGMHYLHAAADHGNRDAQKNLATIYMEGDGVEKNEKLAEKFREQATQNGYEQSYKKALDYLNGNGVEKNEEKAYSIFCNLFALSHTRSAEFQLGLMQRDGIGTEQNLKQGIWHLKSAAAANPGDNPELGYVPAQLERARMYIEGNHVVKDLDKAAFMAELALKKRTPGAVEILEEIYKQASELATKVPELNEQLFVAQKSQDIADRVRKSLAEADQARKAEILLEPMFPN